MYVNVTVASRASYSGSQTSLLKSGFHVHQLLASPIISPNLDLLRLMFAVSLNESDVFFFFNPTLIKIMR